MLLGIRIRQCINVFFWVSETTLCLLISEAAVLLPNFGLLFALADRQPENLAWQPRALFGVLDYTDLDEMFFNLTFQ